LSASWDPVAEHEWLTSSDALRLRMHGPRVGSLRKDYLLHAACFRRFWRTPSRGPSPVSPEDLEKYADGLPSAFDALVERGAFLSTGIGGSSTPGYVNATLCFTREDYVPFEGAERYEMVARCEQAEVANLLRDVLGNPFRPAPLLWFGEHLGFLSDLTAAEAGSRPYGQFWMIPNTDMVYDVGPPGGWLAWNNQLLPRLAGAIYEERRFENLPVLADALEEAGCTNGRILDHCRGPGPHVRGCWLLDLILGRS
jgi:hypothetical protein